MVFLYIFHHYPRLTLLYYTLYLVVWTVMIVAMSENRKH